MSLKVWYWVVFFTFLSLLEDVTPHIFNNKIRQCSSCLCQICENASLLGEGLENWSKRIQIPNKRTLAMMQPRITFCAITITWSVWSHFIPKSNVYSDFNSNKNIRSDVTIKFYSDIGYSSKTQMTLISLIHWIGGKNSWQP